MSGRGGGMEGGREGEREKGKKERRREGSRKREKKREKKGRKKGILLESREIHSRRGARVRTRGRVQPYSTASQGHHAQHKALLCFYQGDFKLSPLLPGCSRGGGGGGQQAAGATEAH